MLHTRPIRRKHQPTVEREPHPLAKLERVNYGGGVTGVPVGKSVPKRNPALLEMAQNRPCLLLVPAICNHRLDTTVACHSNLGIHGKAGARKADDQYSVWGCFACHSWLDSGKARASDKELVFMAAHLRQVLFWREIATSASEPERFRKAAQWALNELGATPVGG